MNSSMADLPKRCACCMSKITLSDAIKPVEIESRGCWLRASMKVSDTVLNILCTSFDLSRCASDSNQGGCTLEVDNWCACGSKCERQLCKSH